MYASFKIGDDGLLEVPKAVIPLNVNGGTAATVTSISLAAGHYNADAVTAAVKAAKAEPTRTGYTLVGWTATATPALDATPDADFEVTATMVSNSTADTPTDNAPLYAIWTENQVELTAGDAITTTYGTATTKVLPAATKGTGDYTYTLTTLPTGVTFDATTRTVSVANTVAAGDITLTYAVSDNNLTDTGKKAASDTVTIKVAKADPVVTIDKTQITEETTLAEIKDLVSVAGVVAGDALTNAGFQLVDETGTALTDLTAKVVPDQKYYYTYTPDITANYNILTKVETTLLSQTKANVTFKVQGSGKLVDTDKTEKSEIVVELDKDAKITAPATVDGLNTKFYGWYKGDVKVEDMSKETATADVTYTAVFKTYHEHYMQGTGTTVKTFEPEKPMTRAQAAVMLANLNGFDPNADYKDAGYTDVSAETIPWAYKQINFVTQEGFMKGKGYISASNKNGFAPNEPITRQEMATILGRSNGITEVTTGDTFDDIDKAASWAKGFLTAMKQQNLIEGRDGKNFDPTANLKRAEAAKMVNYAQGRKPDTEKMDKKDLIFKDVEGMADWAVYNVIEATVDHFEEAFH